MVERWASYTKNESSMRVVCILCLGVLSLLVMEIGYSLEIKRYDTSRLTGTGVQQSYFSFRGPVAVTLRSMLHGATAAQVSKAHAI
jgi:hypothetical protein